MIEEAERTGARWNMPWHKVAQAGAPYNGATGRAYNGVNIWLLSGAALAKGYDSPAWATFKQWKARGGSVRKGEKGEQIVFFKPMEKVERDSAGKEQKKRFFILRAFHVFNVAQVDGVKSPAESVLPEKPCFEPHEYAERIATESGADIRHGGNHACFIPALDQVRMPPREAFKSGEGYYSTLLHELTHWTGHESRLDRLGNVGRFGDPAYAFEELVAEIGAAYLCAESGVSVEPRPDHAAYLASWKRAIADDPRAIFRAAKLAEQAAGFLSLAKPQEEAQERAA
jgi:antirestriction protein ArdC